MTAETTKAGVEAFKELVVQAFIPFTAGEDEDGIPLVTVPPGYSVESLEQYLPAPTRIRATVSVGTVESFNRYVNEFKQGASRLFADPAKMTVTAVLDYHGTTGSSDAQWCTHQVKLTLSTSQEWKTWKALHKQAVGQVAFAEHIEDNYLDIIEPDNATILEVAKSLEASKEVKFRSGVNLTTGGIELTYDETIEGRTKGGNVEVPKFFTLCIPIFEGGEPQKIQVRLRYRINDGKLSFVYLIERPERLVSDAVEQVLIQIRDATEIEPLIGSVSTQN